MGLKILPDPIGHFGRGSMQVVGGGVSYKQIVLSLAPLAYWPLNEAVGTTGAGSVLDASGNGYHATPTAVTFGATGIGDGKTAAAFDGATSFINFYSAGLSTAWNGDEFTIALWIQVDVAAWSDGVNGDALSIYSAGFGNNIEIYKTSANVLNVNFGIGGSSLSKNFTLSQSTAWVNVAITRSVSNNRARVYINGVQDGADVTGSGAWANGLQSTASVLGASNAVPQQLWDGNIAHVVVVGRELSAAEVASIASPFDGGGFLPLGDSKTVGATDEVNGTGYPIILSNVLNNTGRYYREMPTRIATGGWKITDLRAAIVTQIPALTITPKYALINIGVNDAGITSKANFQADMVLINAALLAKWPYIRIGWARVWYQADPSACATLDGWIGELVPTTAGTFLGPDERIVLENGDDGATLTGDGVHPNHAGYTAMAAAWRSAMGL
jgi:lysophospholipase L1-like esterase